MQLLYVVSAAILGSETARSIFHVESIIQDPNVQELIREWEDKGRVEGRAEEARRLLHKVLAARGLPVTAAARARIKAEADLARLEAWLEAAVTAGALDEVFRSAEVELPRAASAGTRTPAHRTPRKSRTRTRGR